LTREASDQTFGEEAKSFEGHISATRRVVADWLQWLSLPPVSGIECMQALQRDGFRIHARPPGCIELERDGLVIPVPLSDQLTPDVLVAVLLRAHVGPLRFLALLERGQVVEPG
jgi:hypothetical protein